MLQGKPSGSTGDARAWPAAVKAPCQRTLAASHWQPDSRRRDSGALAWNLLDDVEGAKLARRTSL